MNQQKGRTVFPVYLILLAIVLISYYFSGTFFSGNAGRETASWSAFEEALTSGKLSDVEIHQNAEVPTGYVRYSVGETQYQLQVSDVNDIIGVIQ